MSGTFGNIKWPQSDHEKHVENCESCQLSISLRQGAEANLEDLRSNYIKIPIWALLWGGGFIFAMLLGLALGATLF